MKGVKLAKPKESLERRRSLSLDAVRDEGDLELGKELIT